MVANGAGSMLIWAGTVFFFVVVGVMGLMALGGSLFKGRLERPRKGVRWNNVRWDKRKLDPKGTNGTNSNASERKDQAANYSWSPSPCLRWEDSSQEMLLFCSKMFKNETFCQSLNARTFF